MSLNGSGGALSLAAYQAFEFLTRDQVFALPDPEPLIGNLLTKETFAALYGPSNVGKSFLALDWALHVATGKDWLDQEVHQCNVVYVYSEGGRGLKRRLMAWEREHGRKVENILFLMQPVPLRNAAGVKQLVDQLTDLPFVPGLLVIDTFAASFEGDENDTEDVMDAIRTSIRPWIRQLQTTVLAVHHTPKAQPRKGQVAVERGSGSFRNNADTMLPLEKKRKDSDVLTLTIDKQRDDATGGKILLKLKVVEVEGGTSCVIASADASDQDGPGDLGNTEVDDASLTLLRSLVVGGRVSRSQFNKAYAEQFTVSAKTAQRRFNALVKSGWVEESGITNDLFIAHDDTAVVVASTTAPTTDAQPTTPTHCFSSVGDGGEVS